MNILPRDRADVIERIENEVEMLDRHLRVLRLVIRNEPTGIVQMAAELSIPDHKVRYSLRVLEEEGLIEPTDQGATTTENLEGYVDRANGRIDDLQERIAKTAIGDDGDGADDESEAGTDGGTDAPVSET
jgi:predicted transcriptional regulator